MKHILLGLAVLAAFWSCEPCDDCGKPLDYEPVVTASFINLDTLSKVDTAISEIAVTKSGYSKLKTSLSSKTKAYTDSVKKYTDSVNSGKIEYQSLLDLYKARKKVLADSTILIDSLTTLLTTESTYLSKIRSNITSGKIHIDTIWLLENGNFLAYDSTDSATTFNLPLLREDTVTSFKIKIKNTELGVKFTYTTEVIVDEVERLVKLRALNIRAFTSDSTKFKCNTSECLDHETSIIFYF